MEKNKVDIKELITATMDVDLFRLNYGFSTKKMGRVNSHPKVKNRTFLYEASRYIFNLLSCLLKSNTYKKFVADSGSVLLFYASENQYKAIKPISDSLGESTLVGLGKKNRQGLQYGLFTSYVIGVLFIPFLVVTYFKSGSYKRKSIRKCFHNYLLTYGYYFVACLRLARVRPSALLISNDHVMWTSALAEAAQRSSIPVIYLQHAPVTSDFPALTYDFAFLNGKDALEKYARAGIASGTEVFLTGPPKFDRYSQSTNTNQSVQKIGICTNRLDSIEVVERVSRSLNARLPEPEICLRPHPADERSNKWRQLADKHGFAYSDAMVDHPFAFLKRVDAVVAGASGIHLEACLMNVVPIFYDFGGIGSDRYGFIDRGLALKTTDPKELNELLSKFQKNKPYVRDKSRPYCATVGTSFDGKSTRLIADLIHQIVDGRSDVSGRWKKCQMDVVSYYSLERENEEYQVKTDSGGW